MQWPPIHNINFFKYLYDSEHARYRELIDRGKLFLSIITIYLGLIAIAVDETIPFIKTSIIGATAYVISVICLVVGLAFVVLSVGLFKYEYPSDPLRILDGFRKVAPTDDDFTDERLVDFAVATKRNFKLNKKRAGFLRASSVMLLLGALGQALFFVQFSLSFIKGN